jgi:CRP-like cAMP-binding protein
MDPILQLRQALAHLSEIPDPEWAAFSEKLLFSNYKKGEFLCREGQTENYIFYLLKGATRNYFTKDGKEYTVDFHFEGDMLTAYYSFLTRRPSLIALEVIEDVEAILIPREHLLSFYEQNRSGEKIGRLMAEMQYIRRLDREMELLADTAEERYAKLIKRNPQLVQSISVKHLSSYLGIQPESLSRIRKQFGKN